MELFDKLDERKNGHIKLETFIAGVHFQQKHMANVTSTPPPAVGWAPKMVNYKKSIINLINLVNSVCLFYDHYQLLHHLHVL